MARLITDFESALPTLSKAVFSQPIDKTDYTKVSIRPVMLRGQLQYQLERFRDNKAFHQNVSGESMDFFDAETGEKYIPYVVEPSLGADRVALAFLCDAYDEEVIDEEKNDTRVVLHLHPALAPVKAAILPLSKKLSDNATDLFTTLAKKFNVEFDETGSIGKRYRRQDEIGTPFCICYDFESVDDGCVTVRDRDTMEQVRMPISEVAAYIESKLEF